MRQDRRQRRQTAIVSGVVSFAEEQGSEPLAVGRRQLGQLSGERFQGGACRWRGVFGQNCTGFCSAASAIWCILRGICDGFESRRGYLLLVQRRASGAGMRRTRIFPHVFTGASPQI